jgi:hypothetical protein
MVGENPYLVLDGYHLRHLVLHFIGAQMYDRALHHVSPRWMEAKRDALGSNASFREDVQKVYEIVGSQVTPSLVNLCRLAIYEHPLV